MAAFAFALTSALRIASLDLCADEYLLALAADDQVAAISRLSHDPAESVNWRRARRFPAHRGRLEQLVPDHPDVLIAVGGVGGRATATIARKLGWKLVILPSPSTPQDVAANLDRVAQLLGQDVKARRWRLRLARIEHRPLPDTDAAFLSGGGLSLSPDSLGSRWMRLAGFRQRSVPGGRLTLERLALDPPAVLLRSDYRSGQLSLGQRWLEHPLVKKSGAKRIRTDGRVWTCGGPPMLDEVEQLRKAR